MTLKAGALIVNITPSVGSDNMGDYPEATKFIDLHFYVFDVNPPNNLELMGMYVEAFQKVMDNLDQIP